MVLTRHHLRRPARAFGDLRVVERGDHVVLPSEPASVTAPAQSRSPRYRPEQALPPVNFASPGIQRVVLLEQLAAERIVDGLVVVEAAVEPLDVLRAAPC